MRRDERFLKGDAVIRRMIEKIAARRGTVYETIERDDNDPDNYVYRLRGTGRSIAFRAKDICFAADPDTLATRIEPRLEAMFEDVWWRRAVVLMRAGGDVENLRRSK